MRRSLACLALLGGLSLRAPHAGAQARGSASTSDRVYIVRAGDTLSRVASHLGVPWRAVAERNYLRPPYALSVGRRLRLPDGVAPSVLRTLPTRDGSVPQAPAGRTRGAAAAPPPANHRAGLVTLVRVRDGGQLTTNFNAAMPNLRLRVERILRARDGTMHTMHPRLLRHLVALSDHFQGRSLQILSGYRMRRGREEGGHHSRGYAIDLRVEGVPLRQVWDFCQTLGTVGCGFYPGGNFVHLDLRPAHLAWTVGARTGHAGDPNTPAEDDVSTVLQDAGLQPPSTRR